MKNSPDFSDFVNPIDKDKIAENPGFLPYAHTVSGPVIKPEDQGKIKSNAVSAMVEQTDVQLKQIYKQIELLAQQAKAIQDRKEISTLIYNSEMRFDPIIGHVYNLYRKKEGNFILSMIDKDSWGKSMPYEAHLAKVKLLSDHTWEILEQ